MIEIIWIILLGDFFELVLTFDHYQAGQIVVDKFDYFSGIYFLISFICFTLMKTSMRYFNSGFEELFIN